MSNKINEMEEVISAEEWEHISFILFPGCPLIIASCMYIAAARLFYWKSGNCTY